MGEQQWELEELVLRSMARDTNAFEALVRHYHKRLLYYILRMIRDHDRAEDILQNVWVDVYQQLRMLRSTKAFSAWLFRIARNHTCRDIRRSQSSVMTKSLEEITEEIPVAEERSLSEDEVATIHRCMDRLSPEHREVLILRFMEELSYQQIAEIVGCSIGTVRSRIYYAKQTLSIHLEDASHE